MPKPAIPKPAITNKLSQSDVTLFYDIFFNLLDFINKRDRIIPSLLPTIHSFTGTNSLEPAEIKQIASVVWTNPVKEIDAYLATAYLATADSPKDSGEKDSDENDKNDNDEKNSDKREILQSWKHCVNGQFFIERHLKSGSVLIGRPETADTADNGNNGNNRNKDNRSVISAAKKEDDHNDHDNYGNHDSVFLVCGLNSSIEEMFPSDYFPLPIIVKATLLPFKGRIITDGLVQRYNIFSGGGVKKMLRETYSEAKRNGRIITNL